MVRVCHHRRDEKGINHPTDSQESACDEPDEAGDGATEVEAVHPGKPENPSDVRDEFAVGGRAHGWDWVEKRSVALFADDDDVVPLEKFVAALVADQKGVDASFWIEKGLFRIALPQVVIERHDSVDLQEVERQNRI